MVSFSYSLSQGKTRHEDVLLPPATRIPKQELSIFGNNHGALRGCQNDVGFLGWFLQRHRAVLE